jgi:hypothetical protein
VANPEKISRSVRFPGGEPAQIVYGSGDRVVATASTASTAEAALPTGARLIELRAAGAIWIRFGNTGMGAAAADADSILFPAGEKPMPVPLDASGNPYDFFRVLRVSTETADVAVQIERINVAA